MTKSIQNRFKKDEYRAARGGRSEMLDLRCDRCGKHVALYQKDGPGPLKRMYLDRIFKPAALADLATVTSVKKLRNLTCSGCGEELGIPMIYDKEERLAFKLFESVISKKKVSLSAIKS